MDGRKNRESRVRLEARRKGCKTSWDRCRGISALHTRASLVHLELESVIVRNNSKLKSEEPNTLTLGYRSQVGRGVKFFLRVKDPFSRLKSHTLQISHLPCFAEYKHFVCLGLQHPIFSLSVCCCC